MKFHELRGIRILDVADAQDLGVIDDLYVDLGDQRVLALRVKTPGLLGGHKSLLLQDIKSIGHDAVTVTGTDSLGDKGNSPALEHATGRDVVEGARVMTESGAEVGTVADLDADFSTGVINGYVLRGGLVDRLQHLERLVPASTVKSIGDKTIVVADSVVSA